MYSARPGLIFGFHGCEKSVRDNVVSVKTMLRPSKNSYDWLGKGIYFWESNYDRAIDFARNPPGKRKYKNPSVVGAVLDLGYCLDLLDTRYLRLVKDSYETFAATAKMSGQEIPKNQTVDDSRDTLLRKLDCAVIENLHATQRQIGQVPFDSARAVFIEGPELYPNAGFHDKNHVQICVRNPNCIKGFFIPRSNTGWEG